MGILIDIAIEDEDWHLFKLPEICDLAVITTCAVMGLEIEGELSFAFVDDAHIQELNRDFKNKDKPTNVLSFPMDGPMLGDIVLARETIVIEAEQQHKKVEDHLSHLIVHGFLHLLGYDHMNETEAAEMEALEIKALSEMGIDNPYEIKEPDVRT